MKKKDYISPQASVMLLDADVLDFAATISAGGDSKQALSKPNGDGDAWDAYNED